MFWVFKKALGSCWSCSCSITSLAEHSGRAQETQEMMSKHGSDCTAFSSEKFSNYERTPQVKTAVSVSASRPQSKAQDVTESCNSCPLLKGAGEGLAERHQKAKGNWRSLRGEQGSMKNPMLFWNTESKLLFSKIDRCTREMQESLD